MPKAKARRAPSQPDAILDRHRTEIQAARDLVVRLIAELDAASAEPAQLERAVAAKAEGEKSPAQRKAMLKAVSLPGRAATLRDLSATLQRLIALERQAHGIDAKPPEAGPGDLAARMAELDAEFDEIIRDDSEPAAAAGHATGGA